MGFSVTIAEGQDRGREYTFNQPEVSIGRVAENDIVLGDAGVSRKHVLIREEGGKYLVQDLGSANGTKLNGSAITEEELHDGDEISVGPVLFQFVAMPDAGENSTRIFDAATLEKKMKATKEAKAKASAVAAANPKTRQATTMSAAIGGKPKPKAISNPPSKAPSGPSSPTKAPGGALAKKSSAPKAVAPASKRLEEERAAKSIGAKIKLRWSRLPDKVKKGGAVGAVVMGVCVFGVLAVKATHVGEGDGFIGTTDNSKQVFEVTAVPTKDCYGLGPGVTVQTSDKAQFSFNFPVTAKKAIATLTFTAGSVAKSEEVDISVVAVHQAFVQRSFGDDQQNQEVSLQPKYLKPNDKNNVVFDNLKNPPGQEPWVVCNVAVRVEQLPDGSSSDLKEQARAEILNADRFYQDRLISAGNLFAAWKAYRKAGLFLEAMDEKIDEYDVVKQKIRDCRRELDDQCSKLMLKGAAFEKQNKISDAIDQYKYSLRFFPEKDHPCFGTLHGRLSDLE